ncbi:MAG TPA: hypothetical protein VIL30_23250 [Ramlibacter sp.]|jgi:hypothetical protein
MSNHKNHLKLTGDTHPPELDDIAVAQAPADDIGGIRFERTADASTATAEAPQQSRDSGPSGKSSWLDGLPFADTARGYASRAGDYAGQAREQVAQQPLKALAIAAAVGFVFAKLARR